MYFSGADSILQPDAPGVMVQVGFNAGPRHAQVFGLAKSYAKCVDDITKVEHDNDIIAATAVVWGVAKAWLPANITEQRATFRRYTAFKIFLAFVLTGFRTRIPY
ncbi:hypothetical protein B0H13DRAFT_1641226 [Mycena leptocephala]|nr:hypothetical protein B0H13DRAFT_1641226 [Mycena leptocephala]